MELQGRDHEGHGEEAHRVDGADADVVGPVEPVDLEHQRLGGLDRAAAGDEVDLGEGLEPEDHQHDQQEQQHGEISGSVMRSSRRVGP